MDRADIRNRARRLVDPVVAIFARIGVPPTLVTLVGLAVALYGAALVADGRLRPGALLLLAAGLCDVFDGDLARRRDAASEFGAFIDSTLDRVSEFAYFGAIVYYLARRVADPPGFELAVTLVALAGSVLTSYARARAEGLGVECHVGWMERPERIALLTLGLLVGHAGLVGALTLIAVGAMLTFLQRVFHVRRELGRRARSLG